MLKIKDNVDLKALGFKEYSELWFKDYLQIDKETRRIYVTRIDSAVNLLFDLITSGMVEKVVEDEQD